MSIKFTCEECFFDYTVKDQLAGKRIKCKECGAVIHIPDVDQFDDDDFLEELPARREKPQKQSKPDVKKRKKKSARKPYNSGPGTPAIVGGIGTFLLIAFFVLAKTGLLQNMIPTGVKWQKYTSPDGNITALVSGKVKEKKMPVDPTTIVSQRIDVAENRYFACGVSSIQMREAIGHPLTGSPLNPAGIKLYLLPEVSKGFPGSKVLETSERTISGIPILIAKIQMDLPGGIEAINEMGIISIGEYLYSIEFITQKGKSRESDKNKFFDSIKFSDALVQKYQALNPVAAPPAVAKNEPHTPVKPKETPPKTTPTVSPPVTKMTPKPTPKPTGADDVIPEKIVWSVEPDPLAEIPNWRVASRIAINLPSVTTVIHRPDPYGQFFTSEIGIRMPMQGGLHLYSLSTGKRVSTFSDPPKVLADYCLSPDAKFLAVENSIKDQIEIWNIRSGKLLKTLVFDDSGGKILQRMFFADPTHLLIIQRESHRLSTSKFNLYNLSQQQTELEASTTFIAMAWKYDLDIVRSASHRYLAGTADEGNGILILDWKNEKMAGELKIKNSPSGSNYNIEGMAFSPDGNSLAVFLETNSETAVIGFSTSTGKIDWQHEWEHGFDKMVPHTRDDKAKNGKTAVNWLPDSSAYSLNGRVLVDAKTGKFLWYLISKPDPKAMNLHNNRPFHLTNNGMLSIETDGAKSQLQLKKFSGSQLQKSVALLDQPDLLKIGPGKKVQLSIEIDTVREAEKEEVLEELMNTWKDKLFAVDIEVVDEQADYTLHFDYRELSGESVTFREMGKIKGQGNSYPMTKMQYRVQWIPTGESKSLWEIEDEYTDSIYSVRGKVTAKLLRDSVYTNFKEEILALPIVYLIPKDDKLPMLPQYDTTIY